MKKTLPIGSLLLLAVFTVGCNHPTITESKQEAYSEWANSRAKIYHTLASDLYKNGQLVKARKRAIEAIAIDDTIPELRLLLGKIYIEEGNYPGAVAELGIATEQMSESSEAFYYLGVARERNSQTEEAITSYNRSFELNRNNIAPVEALTEVLVSLGEVSQGQMYLEKHMNHEDAQPGTYELAGRIAMMLKQYDKAVAYFQQACDTDTKNHRYPEFLGEAWFRNRDFRAAARVFENILKKKNYTPSAWVYEMQGDCYTALQKNKQAEVSYREACKLRKDNAETWVKLAKSALLQTKTTSAIHAAQQALRVEVTNLEATMVLAYSMVLNGNFSTAIAVLEKALTVHSEDPMLTCLLGKAYAQSGNKDKARELFASAMRVEPQNIVARELFLRSDDRTLRFSKQKLVR